MKDNFTSVTVVLDKSGSMGTLSSDTIGSFNNFIAEQKVIPGDCAFTLCTFNTDYTLVHDFIELNSVPELTALTYKPSGGTALLDAMGSVIDSLGKKIDAMPEDDKPSKNLVVVITDGMENSSKNYSKDKIFSMISHQTTKYNWEFMFFGCTQDQIEEGQSYGFAAQNTIGYSDTKEGIGRLYSNISDSTAKYRSK